MKQVFCFLAARDAAGNWLIQDQELFHLERVLRLKPGDRVQLIDGQGSIVLGRLDRIGKSEAVVMPESIESVPMSVEPVAIAVPALKHGVLDEVLPGLVELGVDTIAVFRAEGGERDRINDKTLDRWQRIILAACKQSKRPWFPALMAFESLAGVLEETNFGQIYFFDELAESSQQIQLAMPGQPTLVVVGNEAGLGGAEREVLRRRNVRGIRFGRFVMRSTTALLAAATLLEAARSKQNP